MALDVSLTVAGVEYAPSAMWASCSFEEQQNAQPGMFQVTLKDPDQTLGPFATGAEVIFTLGGDRRFGGFVTQVSSSFAFAADKTPTQNRVWILRGVDYNVLFDWRITVNALAPTTGLPTFGGDEYDGDLIKFLCEHYLDLPADLDYTTYVDNVVQPVEFETRGDPDAVGAFKQQGTVWREQMEMFVRFSGAVFYIDPNKNLHYHAIESVAAPFDFSDAPSSTQCGIREVTATKAVPPANRAHVWGGSEWTEDVTYASQTNAGSVTDHNLWEVGETHFGEDGYKLSTQWRADLIVNGLGTSPGWYDPGQSQEQWTLSFSWFDHNEPSGGHVHAGQLVTTYLTQFGGALNPITLPMRSISISFAGLDAAGDGQVKFTGSLGLALNDPGRLWSYLRSLKRTPQPRPVAAVTNASTTSTYGAFGQFEPTALGGGVYDLPNGMGYIPGTTQVYSDGLLLARNTDYTESDPVAGEITITASAGDLWVVCRTT